MNDMELRHRFRELREVDAAPPPEFHPMWREALVAAERRRPHARWWIAAAAGIAISAALIGLSRRRAPVAAVSIEPDVLYWRAPTDALLGNSRRMLGGSASLFGSVLDGAVAGAAAIESTTRGN